MSNKQVNKYKESDRSSPEKRGYAMQRAFFEDDSTSPEQNIGPDFRPGDVKQLLPGESATSSKKRAGEFFKGVNKAKAEAQEPIGPKYKKGGKVGSASSRADGCAVRGKTKA